MMRRCWKWQTQQQRPALACASLTPTSLLMADTRLLLTPSSVVPELCPCAKPCTSLVVRVAGDVPLPLAS